MNNNRVRVTREGWSIDGRRRILLCASLFYFRIPKELWSDRIERTAQAGYHALDVYIPWNYHEPERGSYLFEGERDVRAFLRLARDAGMYVIARPGPYICSEWDGGALPAWLYPDLSHPETDPRSRTTFHSGHKNLRQADERFLAEVARWYDAILPILREEQFDAGGAVLAVQIDNELDFYPCADPKGYLSFLKECVIKHGITVPILACSGEDGVSKATGDLEGVVPTANIYSRYRAPGLEERARRVREQLVARDTPLTVTETDRNHFTLRRLLSAGAHFLGPYLQVSGHHTGYFAGQNNWGRPSTFMQNDYDFGGMVGPDGELREEFYEARIFSGMITALEPELVDATPVNAPVSVINNESGATERRIASVLSCPSGARLLFLPNLDDEPLDVTDPIRTSVPPHRVAIVASDIDLTRFGVPVTIKATNAEIARIVPTDQGCVVVLACEDEGSSEAILETDPGATVVPAWGPIRVTGPHAEGSLATSSTLSTPTTSTTAAKPLPPVTLSSAGKPATPATLPTAVEPLTPATPLTGCGEGASDASDKDESTPRERTVWQVEALWAEKNEGENNSAGWQDPFMECEDGPMSAVVHVGKARLVLVFASRPLAARAWEMPAAEQGAGEMPLLEIGWDWVSRDGSTTFLYQPLDVYRVMTDGRIVKVAKEIVERHTIPHRLPAATAKEYRLVDRPEPTNILAKTPAAKSWQGDPHYLECLGVHYGAAYYRFTVDIQETGERRENIPEAGLDTDPKYGLWIGGASDAVSFFINGEYLGTALPRGRSVWLVGPLPWRDGDNEVLVRTEIMGHSNFHDTTVPVTHLGSMRGLAPPVILSERSPGLADYEERLATDSMPSRDPSFIYGAPQPIGRSINAPWQLWRASDIEEGATGPSGFLGSLGSSSPLGPLGSSGSLQPLTHSAPLGAPGHFPLRLGGGEFAEIQVDTPDLKRELPLWVRLLGHGIKGELWLSRRLVGRFWLHEHPDLLFTGGRWLDRIWVPHSWLEDAPLTLRLFGVDRQGGLLQGIEWLESIGGR